MSYIDKYSKIKPFVKLNIPSNKKNFTTAEKSLITKYYNRLNSMGYFHREQEGFIYKNISRSKHKVHGLPRIKKISVNVGTRVIDGKIITDNRNKIKIINGRVVVAVPGKGNVWRFGYNINKDWDIEDFKKHLLKQMGQKNIKDHQYFAIGAGIYEMSSTKRPKLDMIAEKILAIANHYKSQNELIEEGEAEGEIKNYSDFMQEVVVYENKEVAAEFLTMQKKRKKKRKVKKNGRN